MESNTPTPSDHSTGENSIQETAQLPGSPLLEFLAESMPTVGGTAVREWVVPRIQHLSAERVRRVLFCTETGAESALRGEVGVAGMLLLANAAGYKTGDVIRAAHKLQTGEDYDLAMERFEASAMTHWAEYGATGFNESLSEQLEW